MDIVIWLVAESFFAFVFYFTGCIILKVTTFGQYHIEFNSFTSFKQSKKPNFNLAYFVGLLFYVGVIVLLVLLNS
ncbi:MAG: hypothetical protein ACI9LM_000762 [Alteromonadaceae bacterium]|jgi:hypothetical protein